MKESNTVVYNATIKQLPREILLDTKGRYMKESSTVTGNATIKQHRKEILPNIKGLNPLAGIAQNNFHQREKLLYTKRQYMKESNTLAENVANDSLTTEVLFNTRSLYMEANKL